MTRPRIQYADLSALSDPGMLEELARARREGTPRVESHAIRALVPPVFWSFVNTWNDVFRSGIVEHEIKELCRVYVSKSVNCAYCGGQRSMEGAAAGLVEDDYKQLLDFEHADRYDSRQKAALSLAEAIAWDREADDTFWSRLHQHFSDAQVVELGYFIGFTMGQQRFNRLLDLERHPVPSAATPSV